MKVALIQLTHSDQMGYADRFLGRELLRLGVDVHLVTSNGQPYFRNRDYDAIYAQHFGPPTVPCGSYRNKDGVVVHRLPHAFYRGQLRIAGLGEKLAELRPDVVQVFDFRAWSTYEAAWHRIRLGYHLFLEAHVHASVFAPARRQPAVRERARIKLLVKPLGKFLSAQSERCYAISPDCADIAIRFFGLSPHKVVHCPLGTDTKMFRPPETPEERTARESLRRGLGFGDDELVCLHTGRLTDDKGPRILAQAVVRLIAEGLPVRGLFVGHGPPAVLERIRRTPGCVVHAFVPCDALPPLYQAADIGVWPKQESTSQLDAVAAGLPLIVDEDVTVTERIDGNGLTYAHHDPDDLADQIRALLDPARRAAMAATGRQRMIDHYDWRHIAVKRLADYEEALRRARRSGSHAASVQHAGGGNESRAQEKTASRHPSKFNRLAASEEEEKACEVYVSNDR